MENKFEVFGAVVTFREDDILHIHYTSESLNLNHAKDLISKIKEKSPWQLAPVLVSADPFSEHDNDAQKYLAGEDVMERSSAIAVITPNMAQRIAVNFFIRFKKPSKPTRFFNTEKEALTWLAGYESVLKGEGLSGVKSV